MMFLSTLGEGEKEDLVPGSEQKDDDKSKNTITFTSAGELLISRNSYVGFSAVLLIWLMTEGACPVKTTYRQEFLSGFSSNPFY